MNICIFAKVTLVHSIGGMQIHCKTLSEELAKRGHKVNVITTRHPAGLEYEENDGIKIHYLGNTRPGTYYSGWWKESIKKFEELHKQKPFDIILSESVSSYYYACKLKSKYNVPLVTIIHGHPVKGDTISEWKNHSIIYAEKRDYLLQILNEYVKIIYYLLFLWSQT